MGWKLDIKSAILGGVVVAVAAIFVGAGKPEPTVGRYQIASGGALNGLVIDTMTGQVWAENRNDITPVSKFWEPKLDTAK